MTLPSGTSIAEVVQMTLEFVEELCAQATAAVLR
jgi:hypothetical protein